MSAKKRSVSMDEELYTHVMKRTRECKFHDKGSKFIQALIRADISNPISEPVRPKLQPVELSDVKLVQPKSKPLYAKTRRQIDRRADQGKQKGGSDT